MKLLLITLLIILTSVLTVKAAEITLAWDTVPNAAGYVLEMSSDGGRTWSTSDLIPVNVTEFIWTNVPDQGLVLWRISSVYPLRNVVGCINCAEDQDIALKIKD